jgi:hypothetical protein
VAISIGSRAILEATITAQKVIQLFDDDGDGAVASSDLTTLNTFIARADAVTVGILLHKGFSVAQLTELAADDQIKHAWACICAQLAGERKTEWLDENGKGPYEAMGARARSDLTSIATGLTRLETETTAGSNATISGEYRAPCPPFVFNADPRDPYRRPPGGF